MRARAEEHVAELYRAAGYSPPGRFVWSGSPFALARACTGRLLGGGRDLTPEIVNAPVALARRELAANGMEQTPLSHPAAVISEAIGSMIAGLELRWPVRWLPRSGPPLRGWNPMHGATGDIARLHAMAESRRLHSVQRAMTAMVSCRPLQVGLSRRVVCAGSATHRVRSGPTRAGACTALPVLP